MTWGGAPVLVLVVGVYLPGLGDGLLSLLAYLGLGQCGIPAVGSLGVGVREGAGVLVLRSLRGVPVFGCLSAWVVLARDVFLLPSLGCVCVVLISGVCLGAWLPTSFYVAFLPRVSSFSLAVGLVLMSVGSLFKKVDCSSCVLLPPGELGARVFLVFPCPDLADVPVFDFL